MRGRGRHRTAGALVALVALLALGIGYLILRPSPAGSAADPGPPSAGAATTRPATTPPPGSTLGSTAGSAPGAGAFDGPTYPVLRVVDGDTVNVRVGGQDETVRILGINAPETDQCWGSEATRAAARLLDGAAVTLVADPTQSDRDRYGRLLRYVGLADGTDVGRQLVEDGDADERTYDGEYARQGDYRAADAAAAAAGRGLHDPATCNGNPAPATPTDPTRPAEPTVTAGSPAGSPEATATGQTGPNGCDIKGNISGNGKIYHLPGSADYDRTRIDESRGERWFCSEAEAQAAGWRARN